MLSRDHSDLIDAEECNVRATTEVVYGSQVAERGPGLPQPAVHTEMTDEAAADPVRDRFRPGRRVIVESSRPCDADGLTEESA